jgi:hypothetical protein
VPSSTFFEFRPSSEFHLITTSAIVTQKTLGISIVIERSNAIATDGKLVKIGAAFFSSFTDPQMNANQSDFVMTRHSICLQPTGFLDQSLDCGKQLLAFKRFFPEMERVTLQGGAIRAVKMFSGIRSMRAFHRQ